MKIIIAAFFYCYFVSLPQALACAVCFGDPNSKASQGVVAGVLSLLAIIGCVLVAIATTAFRWSKRSKKLHQEHSM